MRSLGKSLASRVLAVAAAGALAAARTSAQPAPDVGLSVYIGGLVLPLGFVNAGDGSGRNFVVTQRGKVYVYQGNAGLGTFLDIGSLIPCSDPAIPCGEQGLLGLAFHPKYATNGLFYVYYVNADGNEVLARYHVSANDPNAADPKGEILLTIPDPYPNHNGGQLQFGPDGYLYVGTGDGGAGGDPQNRAQNTAELLGKILRLDVDATGAVPCGQASPGGYGIPASNPFAATLGACGEIWDLGLRNPWRFSFDRATADILIGDVGQSLYEEIDFEPAGSGGGRNYGWRRMEGFHCYNPATACADATLTWPVLEHDHTQGCSVTGGYVYRGSLYPQLYGVYVYGDYCSGRIWGAVRDDAGAWTKRELATSQFISSFGEDEAGELYVVEHSGTVKRLTSSTAFARPTVSGLAPPAAIKGDPAFDLVVTGMGFTPATVVSWNGSPRPTTYVSRTRVRAAISAADVASSGSASVAAANPAPGGGVSTAAVFAIANRFLDVPVTHPFRGAIEGIAEAGITSGCGSRRFCPDAAVTRDQIAILLLRSEHGGSYQPLDATGSVFADVGPRAFAAAFIEQLVAEGITGGCGSGNYCPASLVTRAPLAKFLLKALGGPDYRPPPPGPVFQDVPTNAPFAAWIDELGRRGIASGCGGGKFCPNLPVTRAELAAFLARTFSIPLAP